jgi:hypothetical protein
VLCDHSSNPLVALNAHVLLLGILRRRNVAHFPKTFQCR